MPASDLQRALDLLEQGRTSDAIDLLTQRVQAVPAHAAAHVVLARAHEAAGHTAAALRAWEQAAFLMPTSPVAAAGKRRALQRLDGAFAGETERDFISAVPAAAQEDARPGSRPDATPKTSRAPDPDDSPASASSESTPSDLEQLRQRAEAEARRGGARGGSGTVPSDLEQLRQQADAEARRGGARSGMAPPSPDADASSPDAASSRDSLDDDFDGDLDRLIQDLESARIEPNPSPSEDAPEDAPAFEEPDDADDLVSETLARIYASQGKYREAARAYLRLAAQDPDRTREHLEQASAMYEEAKRHADASS